MQKDFKSVRLKIYQFIDFIFHEKDKLSIVIKKTILNLSLYQSDRYDKNLSLIYIWSHEYLNVSMNDLFGKWRDRVPISHEHGEIGYLSQKIGYLSSQKGGIF